MGVRCRAARKRGAASTPKAVLQQWEKLKAQEQAATGREERVLSGIPRALPSLLRAHEIGSRVAAVGFDWDQTADVVDKIDEEVRELREALHESPARAAEELGDLLFSLANLARKLDIEPESALREANDKFTQPVRPARGVAGRPRALGARDAAHRARRGVAGRESAAGKGRDTSHVRPDADCTYTVSPSVSIATAPSRSVLKIVAPACGQPIQHGRRRMAKEIAGARH